MFYQAVSVVLITMVILPYVPQAPKEKVFLPSIYDQEMYQKLLKDFPPAYAHLALKEKKKSFWHGFGKGVLAGTIFTLLVIVITKNPTPGDGTFRAHR